jgi:hypothetical protein
MKVAVRKVALANGRSLQVPVVKLEQKGTHIMATVLTSRNTATSTTRSVARRLLSKWQRLNQLQRDVFAQMAEVESELSAHVQLNRYTEYRGVRGSFADAFLDSNLDLADDRQWLSDAIDAACA